MYRFRLRVFFLLLVTFGLVAGAVLPQPPSDASPKVAKVETIFTLRLVFDGLVTFWEPDKTEKPGEMWVLIGNASQPKLLPVAQNMPPHQAELLVQKEVQTSGRPLASFTQGDSVDPAHPHLSIPSDWLTTPLDDEELVLVATTPTPLTIVRNKASLPEPKDAGQEEDLLWTVDLDELLSKVPQGTQGDKQLKACLRSPIFSCEGKIPLLSTRLHLQNGRVYARNLVKNAPTRFAHYAFPSVPSYQERAIAQEIVAELEVHGAAEIQSKPLTSAGGKKDTLTITGKPGEIIEVRIGNHPTITKDQAITEGLLDSDFLFTYNLLNTPGFMDPSMLPKPRTSDGTTFNAQCSPNNSTGG